MATESESVGQLQYVQGLSRAHLTPDESAQLDEAIEGARTRLTSGSK